MQYSTQPNLKYRKCFAFCYTVRALRRSKTPILTKSGFDILIIFLDFTVAPKRYVPAPSIQNRIKSRHF